MAHNRRLTFLRYFLRTQSVQGFTLIEALVTISVVGVLAAIAAPNITSTGSNPLRDSSNRLASQLRLTRAKAIAQTSAYRIRATMVPSSTDPNVQTKLIIERGNSCKSANWVKDLSFADEDVTTSKKIELYQSWKDGAVVTPNSTNWTLCINSRGIADRNIRLQLRLIEGGSGPTKDFEILAGGAIQVYGN
jgi:type IV fimbrial biogenesis protein FimT